MKSLSAADEQLFLYLNGKHNSFFDPIMYWASNEYFWIPLYLLVFLLLLFRYKSYGWYVMTCIALLIAASDQISSKLIKDLVCRPRPSHNLALAGQVHLSKAGPGGLYGFVSSHASNSFSLLVFLCLILPKEYRLFKFIMTGWALLLCYSRIYNGVHYPGDVLGGMLLGTALAFLFRWLFAHFTNYYMVRLKRPPHYD